MPLLTQRGLITYINIRNQAIVKRRLINMIKIRYLIGLLLIGAMITSCSQIDDNECVCTEIYQPVCGIDGTTYANSCFASITTTRNLKIKLDSYNTVLCPPPTRRAVKHVIVQLHLYFIVITVVCDY